MYFLLIKILFTFLLFVLEEFQLWFTPSSCYPDVCSIRSLLPLRTLTSLWSVQCWTFFSTHSTPTFTEFLPSVEAESPSFAAKASSPMCRSTEQTTQVHWLKFGPTKEPVEWVLPIQANISHPTLWVTALPRVGKSGHFLWSYYSEKKD